jgi:hypothetical protein
MRMVPAGLSRSLLNSASSASISSKRGSSQKSQTQSSFEAADGVAQRRLRNAELRRRPREAALPRDGEESKDVVQILPKHL